MQPELTPILVQMDVYWFPQNGTKWLLPDTLPYIEIYPNAFAAGAQPRADPTVEAHITPPDLLADQI